MKKYYLLFFTFFLFFSGYAADSLYTEKKADPDILKMKAIGRYDRGIINYRFIPKGQKMFGVTASYAGYDSNDSQLLSILEELNYYAKTLRVNPFIGYFYKDNQVVGVKLGYANTFARLDNVSLAMDDLDFTLSDIQLSETLFNTVIYHRSYVGLDSGRRFGLFNETYLSYNSGNSSFSRLADEKPVLTETRINQIQLGINPGISVFMMQNVCAEFSFGVAGITYRSEKQKIDQVESGSFKRSGANFKINLLNINIGVTVCL
ncbi:MAG: hypothetical protein RR202_13275 [Bacteroidales bacterium]